MRLCFSAAETEVLAHCTRGKAAPAIAGILGDFGSRRNDGEQPWRFPQAKAGSQAALYCRGRQSVAQLTLIGIIAGLELRIRAIAKADTLLEQRLGLGICGDDCSPGIDKQCGFGKKRKVLGFQIGRALPLGAGKIEIRC